MEGAFVGAFDDLHMLALQSESPGAGGDEPHGPDPKFDPEVRPTELVIRDSSLVVRLVPKLHFFKVDFGPEERLVAFLLPENATIRLFDFFQ